MKGFRALAAAIVLPLTALIITVIGIEQVQAGGEGVSNGIRALIVAAVVWLLAIVAVRNLLKVGGEVAESIAADANSSATRSPEDNPPERIM